MIAYVLHLAFVAAVATFYGLAAVVTVALIGMIGRQLLEEDNEE